MGPEVQFNIFLSCLLMHNFEYTVQYLYFDIVSLAIIGCFYCIPEIPVNAHFVDI